MSHNFFLVLLSVLVIGIALASHAWTRYRATKLLGSWAMSNGYQLLQSEPRYARTGPYFWRHSRGQVIYYITIADPRGSRRTGYVRLGGWLFGLLSNQVDVTWDS